MRSHAVQVLILLIAGAGGTAFATDRLVPQQYSTVQAAVNASADGDVIRIAAPGLSERGIQISGRRLTVEGAGGQIVTLDALQLGRHVSIVGNSTVTLRNIRFVNGRESGSVGGAVRFQGTSLVVDGCAFDGNRALEGGAIVVESGVVRIGRCWFSANASNLGQTGFGGALRHVGGEVTVCSSRFSGNSSSYEGGAVSHGWGNGTGDSAGALRIDSCLFDSNSSVYGGALHTYRSGQAVTLTNATMVGNSATWGSTIDCYYGQVRLVNSIVKGSGSLFRSSYGGSLRGLACVIGSGSLVGTGIRVADPMLSVDFVPMPGSPCIDSGSLALLTSTLTATGSGSSCAMYGIDLVGNPRIMDVLSAANSGCGSVPGTIDIGAIEVPGVVQSGVVLMDLDGDGRVSGLDIGALLGAWGQADCVADLNVDGIVNATDLGLLLGRWGLCQP